MMQCDQPGNPFCYKRAHFLQLDSPSPSPAFLSSQDDFNIANAGTGLNLTLTDAMINSNADAESPKEVDIWRDTPVRLLGYANEVGESFRALVHVNWVRLSYGVAFAYVLADTNDKMKKELDPKKKTVAAVDTLIWQTLASVAVPGFTINRLCAFSLFALSKTRLSLPIRKWTTTAIGLASIPFIVKPIDHGVDVFMDHSVRKVLR